MFGVVQIRTLAIALAVTASACGGSSLSKEQYLENGNKYASEKKYAEAVLEYRNAIKVDDKFGPAHLKLSDAYLKLNDGHNALLEANRAADLMSEDDEAQLASARLLILARKFDDVKQRAMMVLARNPKNVEAQILKGNALLGVSDIDAALKDVRAAIASDPNDARSYAALGVIQTQQGQRDEAEAAFKQAVAAQPDSFVAQIALGHFYWSIGKLAEAEGPLKRATDIAPGNVLALRALITYYMATNRVKDTQAPLKQMGTLVKTVESRIALAEMFIDAGLPDDGRTTLVAAAKDPDGFADATVRLASLDFAQNRPDQATDEVDAVLAKYPKHVEGLMLKARFLAAKGELDNAIVRAKEATVGGKRPSADTHYLLGLLYTRRNLVDEAVAAYDEAVKINPQAVEARLQLAMLHLYKAQQKTALRLSEEAVKIAPGNSHARLMLGRMLTANLEAGKAEEVLKALATEYPNNAEVQNALGELLMLKKDNAAARKAFDKAAGLDTTSFDAIRGQVSVELLQKNTARAVAIVEERLKKTPRDPGVLMLAAQTYAAVNDLKKQEEALKTLVEVDPVNLPAFAGLAALYASQGRLDEAKAQYLKIGGQSKSEAAPTMVAMILEAQHKIVDAQRAYERVLADHPKAPIAANNLAWLYTEHDGNLDIALELARKAKQDMPKIPDVDDTLGWIYYKKDLATIAVPSLEAAVNGNPKNPLFHYHLGMAYAKAGERAKAGESFAAALKLKPDFVEASEAAKALGVAK